MSRKIDSVFLRTGFNYDRDAASEEAGLFCSDVSLTKQEFKDDADINVIVRRFNVTGQLPVGVHAPVFQDFEGVFDFQSAMNVVAEAESSFLSMPADVRYRFHNNPQEFVAFCSDDRNRAEAMKLGLVFESPEGSGVVSGPAVASGVSGASVSASVVGSGAAVAV